MWWVPLATMAIGAVNQKMEADQANKNLAAQNQLAADKERTSYITGRGGETNFNAVNPYAGMLQGGFTGAMTGIDLAQKYKDANKSMNQKMQMQSKPTMTNVNQTSPLFGQTSQNIMNRQAYQNPWAIGA